MPHANMVECGGEIFPEEQGECQITKPGVMICAGVYVCRYALQCEVMQCNVMQCRAMQCNVMSWHAMCCHVLVQCKAV